MQFAVYADLSRQLSQDERSAVCEALNSTVPDGGCVGLQKGQNDEVFFYVYAAAEEEAREQATRYMGILLRRSEVKVEYELHLQSL